MSVRVVGKGMKWITSDRKFGVVVVDGEGLELSFTPAAVKLLSAIFKKTEEAERSERR